MLIREHVCMSCVHVWEGGASITSLERLTLILSLFNDNIIYYFIVLQ